MTGKYRFTDGREFYGIFNSDRAVSGTDLLPSNQPPAIVNENKEGQLQKFKSGRFPAKPLFDAQLSNDVSYLSKESYESALGKAGSNGQSRQTDRPGHAADRFISNPTLDPAPDADEPPNHRQRPVSGSLSGQWRRSPRGSISSQSVSSSGAGDGSSSTYETSCASAATVGEIRVGSDLRALTLSPGRNSEFRSILGSLASCPIEGGPRRGAAGFGGTPSASSSLRSNGQDGRGGGLAAGRGRGGGRDVAVALL